MWGILCGPMGRLVMILNWQLRGVIVLLSNWPLSGVIVLFRSVYDVPWIGKEFAGSQVRVICWGCGCGNLCGEMGRLVMICNWQLRGVIVLLSVFNDAVWRLV